MKWRKNPTHSDKQQSRLESATTYPNKPGKVGETIWDNPGVTMPCFGVRILERQSCGAASLRLVWQTQISSNSLVFDDMITSL